MVCRSHVAPHDARRAWRSREDASRAGTRTRDRARGRDAGVVRLIGRHSGFVVRGARDCRGARTVRRHGGRPAETARPACGDRPTLLVLDNFEQVLDAASLVADLLTAVAALRCSSPAVRRCACEASGSMPSARSRWRRAPTRCRLPISRALRRCGSSWSAFGTCGRSFASRPLTAPPWRRFAGGSTPCRSRSNSRPRGSKC